MAFNCQRRGCDSVDVNTDNKISIQWFIDKQEYFPESKKRFMPVSLDFCSWPCVILYCAVQTIDARERQERPAASKEEWKFTKEETPPYNEKVVGLFKDGCLRPVFHRTSEWVEVGTLELIEAPICWLLIPHVPQKVIG